MSSISAKEYCEALQAFIDDMAKKEFILPAPQLTFSSFDSTTKRIRSVIHIENYMGKEASVVIVKRPHFTQPLLTVTNRRFGGYSLPGGKRDIDETSYATARRELLEETGLQAVDLSFLFTGWSVVGTESMAVHVYFVRSIRSAAPRNCEEGTSWAWMSFDELCEKSPFRLFYKEHFPDGIVHLTDTLFLPKDG